MKNLRHTDSCLSETSELGVRRTELSESLEFVSFQPKTEHASSACLGLDGSTTLYGLSSGCGGCYTGWLVGWC